MTRAQYGRTAALALAAALVGGASGAGAVSAQSGELRIDAGAARSLPPSGTDAVETSYLLLGLSGERRWSSGTSLGFSLTGGRPLGSLGGDWASGQMAGAVWTDRGGVLNVGLGVRGQAFRVSTPYVYETTTVELFPQVRLEEGPVALTLRGEVGGGRSEIAIHRPDATVRRGTRELWHRGVVAEAATLVPAGVVTAGAGVYEGRAGTYRRGFLEWLVTGPATLRFSGEAWDTPRGVQYAGGVGIYVSLGGGWSLRADGGQGVPDPLVRAPQGVQGGGLLGYAILESGADSPGTSTVTIGDAGGRGVRVVAFRVPGDVGNVVEILGDFTGWDPVPMIRDEDGWTIELPVEPGTHHFGFQVDGVWYLPPNAPGRVPDDWGQENATLVVPGPDSTNDVTERSL